MKDSHAIILSLAAALTGMSANAQIVSFDEAADLLADGALFYNGEDLAGGFTAGDLFFNNTFTDFGGGFTGWSGWSLSRSYDTTTPGFANQYSAIPGNDANENAEGLFAMAFVSGAGSHITLPEFASGAPASIAITNGTYAYLSMLNGDDFAKKFGGADGTDPDFFTLTITGSFRGFATGSIDVALADFTGPEDVILNAWISVDLSSLGERVDTLSLTLASSDVGAFGMNTPAYVAVDNVGFTVTTTEDLGVYELGDNWENLPTIGTYYNPDDVSEGWIYHLPFGWVYHLPLADSALLYGPESGAWYQVRLGDYPFLYDWSAGSWVYVQPESEAGAIILFDYSSGENRPAQAGL